MILEALAAMLYLLWRFRPTRWLFFYLPTAALSWALINPGYTYWQWWLLLTPAWIIAYLALGALVFPIYEPALLTRIDYATEQSRWLTGPRITAALGFTLVYPLAFIFGEHTGIGVAGSLVLAGATYGAGHHLIAASPQLWALLSGADPDGYVLPVEEVHDHEAEAFTHPRWIEVTRETSTLVAGVTRSGKSETSKLLVYQMLREWAADEPLVCYDRKDDWKTFFDVQGLDYEILSAAEAETTVYWDLFGEIETTQDSRRIARELIEESGPVTQYSGFFDTAAQQVFFGIVEVLRRDAQTTDSEPTNADLVRYVQRKSRQEAYDDLREYEELRSAADAIDPDAEAQSVGAWASLTQEIQELFVGAFRTAPPDDAALTLREYIADPDGTALVIDHPHGFGTAVDRIYAYLLDDAIRRAMAHDGGAVLLLDELPQLPQLQRLGELVNVGSGERVRLLATIQSVDQMRDIYGREAATKLLAGMTTKVLLRSGDPETTRFYRDEIGERYVEVTSDSTTVGGISHVASGRSTRTEERAPFDARKLTSLQPGEAIVSREDGWIHAQLSMFDAASREQIDALLARAERRRSELPDEEVAEQSTTPERPEEPA